MALIKLVGLWHDWLATENLVNKLKQIEISDALLHKSEANRTLNEEIAIVLYQLWKLFYEYNFHVLQTMTLKMRFSDFG